jgi:hypothetical protein
MISLTMGGGQPKTLSHFAEIRKQLIWGNKLIMLKIKSLMFDNWINSDLIYINDILNENGEISHRFAIFLYKNQEYILNNLYFFVFDIH